MPKRRRYTDKFIAGALLAYDAVGSYRKVASELKIPESTLRSWDNRRQKPDNKPQGKEVVAEVYADQKKDFLNAVTRLWGLHIQEAEKTLPQATHHEVIGGAKVLFDIIQLMTGGPTQNINQRTMILDFGDAPNGSG